MLRRPVNQNRGFDGPLENPDWVAVKELRLNYHNSEIMLILLVGIYLKFLNSNPDNDISFSISISLLKGS